MPPNQPSPETDESRDKLGITDTKKLITGDQDIVRDEHTSILHQVEEAMGEYFLSLNHLAAALHRLLKNSLFTIDDTVQAIEYIWQAYLCNEHLNDFKDREDSILCRLLTTITKLPDT